MQTIVSLVLLLTSFRFELYQSGQSEVYYTSNNSLYTRSLGSFLAMSYDELEGIDHVQQQLEQAAEELDLTSYQQTPLDHEDRTRDHWIVEAKYSDGHHVQIVKYLDPKDTEADQNVISTLEQIFQSIEIAEPDAIEPRGLRIIGNYHRINVDNDGRTRRRIDYTSEGLVLGGWDRDNPNACF